MSKKGAYDKNFKLVPVEELKVVPIEWQVEGLIEASTAVALYGPPGAAKSFYALDVACSVATGQPFHGREVLAGAVIYVAGEGFNGIARRIEAWSEHNDRRPKNLYISNKSLDLFSPSAAERLEDEIERVVSETGVTPRLIVVDTLARNFNGDENSATDINQFMNNLDEIRFLWGSTVLVVHHTGKDSTRGMRGSTAIPGAVDAAYEFTRNRDGAIQVRNEKVREGKKPDPQGYELVDVESVNSNGDVIQSAILKPVALGSGEMRGPSGKNQRFALDILELMYSESESGVDCQIITKDSWKVHCQGAGLDSKRFAEATLGLIKNGFVVLDGDRVLLPGRGLPDGHAENACPPAGTILPDRCKARFSAPHDTL